MDDRPDENPDADTAGRWVDLFFLLIVAALAAGALLAVLAR